MDSDRRIVPANGDFIRWAIVIVAFVNHVGAIREHKQTMSKAAGYPNLVPVLIAQFNGDMLAKGRAANAYVDSDVEDAAAQNTDELALATRVLQVKAAQHALR